jgi:TonB family protein
MPTRLLKKSILDSFNVASAISAKGTGPGFRCAPGPSAARHQQGVEKVFQHPAELPARCGLQTLLALLAALLALPLVAAEPTKVASPSQPAATDNAELSTKRVPASTLKRIKVVNPVFPQAARDQAVGGKVVMYFTVMPDGSTADVQVIEAEPEGIFEESAVTALQQWRYEPVLRNGQPIAQPTKIVFRFEAPAPIPPAS